jgi:hypothetical protein
MMTKRGWMPALAVVSLLLASEAAVAAVTVFFNPAQVAAPVETGITSDTISCEGYLFTYTRDKLFTGGIGPDPIGRGVRVPWPAGIEAQYVTAGPLPAKASITISRVDGAVFDLTSFTAKLLANAGAGRAIEIVPKLNGEDPFPDPFMFDVTGNYGMSFSYDTSPNPWGSTAALTGYDTYIVNLTLDYALTALTLTDASAPAAVEGGPRATTLLLAPNPAGSRVQISLVGDKSRAADRAEVFAANGARVRSLALEGAGRAAWDLCDDNGRAVAAGVYFVRVGAVGGPASVERLVVVR